MTTQRSTRLSLRTWLFLGFALVSIFPFLVLSIGLTERSWRSRREVAAGRLASAANAISQSVDADHRHLRRALECLAATVQELDLADGAAVDRMLARYHTHYPDFLALLASDRAGRILGSSPTTGADGAPLRGRSVSDRESLRRLGSAGEPEVSDLFVAGGVRAQPVVAIAVPLRRSGGDLGALEGRLDLKRFGTFFAPHLTLPGTEAVMVDRGGRVVAATAGSPFRVDAENPIALPAHGAGRVAVGQFGDRSYLLAGARAELPGWTVVVRQPVSLLVAERRLSHLVAAGWTLVALALSLLLAWAASERAARPLVESERRHRELVQQSFGLFCLHDLAGKILSVNPAGAAAFGLPPKQVVGRSLAALLHPESRPQFAEYLRQVREEGQAEGLMRVVTAAGEERVWMYRNRRLDREGRPPEVAGHAIDVTERRERERELRALALRDPLTGLANRTLFEDRLRQAVHRARRFGQRVALVYLDLDDFKAINDRHGHAAGDAVLRQVAERMIGAVRRVDTVARLGGDELAILLPEIGTRENAERLLALLRSALAEPFRWGDLQLSVGASLGLSLFPEHGETAEELLAAADRAMYAAKAQPEAPA